MVGNQISEKFEAKKKRLSVSVIIFDSSSLVTVYEMKVLRFFGKRLRFGLAQTSSASMCND